MSDNEKFALTAEDMAAIREKSQKEQRERDNDAVEKVRAAAAPKLSEDEAKELAKPKVHDPLTEDHIRMTAITIATTMGAKAEEWEYFKDRAIALIKATNLVPHG